MTNIISNTPSFTQFENTNEGRAYPFAEDASLVATSGSELPDDVIVDLHLMVPDDAGDSSSSGSVSAFVSSVHLSSALVSVCIRIRRGSAFLGALSVHMKASDVVPYRPYRMEKLIGAEDVGGILTFGSFDHPERPKTYFFNETHATISDGCLGRYQPPRLRAFLDPRTGEKVSGDVSIAFSDYITVTRSGEKVRLGLADGASDVLMSGCAKGLPVNGCGATPIETINGIRPDASNRIVLWFH